MPRPNLELVSEVLPVQRRDFYVADTDLLNPLNVNPILDGEFLTLDGNYRLARGGASTVPSWAVFAERGRYDTQAIGKTTLLFLGGYEAETSIVDTAGLGVGSALMVGDVLVDGQNKRGLLLGVAALGNVGVGWVTKVVGNRVRFWNPNSLWIIP